jgi:hypothetical protein
MDLKEARELRKELEAIETTMQRIKGLCLSQDFPSTDDLEELSKTVGAVQADMEGIMEKSNQMPTADHFEGLSQALGNVNSTMESIIEKADQLPTVDEVGS